MGIFAWANPVWAYFDPGSGSLVLQAVVGGAAGLMVFAKYLWRAAAPKLFQPNRQTREPSPSSCDMITIQSS